MCLPLYFGGNIMIKNHNIEFIYNNVASLRFPDGMRFDSENSYDDSLQLVSPDGRLRRGL